MIDTRERLIECAKVLVQTRGYNGFSFHDLAAIIGVKTASIHYHFPTKRDLGEALIQNYTKIFMESIGNANVGTPADCIQRYIGVFKTALDSGRMCLCGMIGAEIGGIPPELGKDLRVFFKENEIWLSQVFERCPMPPLKAKMMARLTISALEGAMLVSRTADDIATFDDVAISVLNLIIQEP